MRSAEESKDFNLRGKQPGSSDSGLQAHCVSLEKHPGGKRGAPLRSTLLWQLQAIAVFIKHVFTRAR